GFGPSTDLQVVVTDFAVNVSPSSATLVAGNSSTHIVTITPQNGPYNSEITLSCASGNLPPQTTCEFNPPAVTPRNGPVTSRLTVTTTARTAAVATAAPPTVVAPKIVTPSAAGSGVAVGPTPPTCASQNHSPP